MPFTSRHHRQNRSNQAITLPNSGDDHAQNKTMINSQRAALHRGAWPPGRRHARGAQHPARVRRIQIATFPTDPRGGRPRSKAQAPGCRPSSCRHTTAARPPSAATTLYTARRDTPVRGRSQAAFRPSRRGAGSALVAGSSRPRRRSRDGLSLRWLRIAVRSP
jgi:hypothetical protein